MKNLRQYNLPAVSLPRPLPRSRGALRQGLVDHPRRHSVREGPFAPLRPRSEHDITLNVYFLIAVDALQALPITTSKLVDHVVQGG